MSPLKLRREMLLELDLVLVGVLVVVLVMVPRLFAEYRLEVPVM
jgi:hypothetical protein